MLKFLRRYNAIILVFGGVLLMITFLIPQALQQLGKGAGAQVLGQIDGKTLTGKSYLRAKRELEIVYTVMPEFVNQWNVGVEHWLLLTIEADQHELLGGQRDGRNFFARLVDETVQQFSQQRANQGQPMPDAEIAAAKASLLEKMNSDVEGLRQRGYPENEVFAAVGKLSGVWRLINLIQPGLPLSTPEAWALGMELFDTATADIAMISGADLAPDPATLSEGQLESHFEQYRDQRPIDNDFGIGYRLPDAVRLEVLRIDRSALNDAIDVDPIELRLHFDDLKAQNFLTGQTFEAVRDQVRASYVNEQSARLMDELTLEVRRELLKSRVGIPIREGIAQLPDDWDTRRPSLEALAAAVRNKVPKPELADAVVHLRSDDGTLLDGAALSALEGTARATYRVNERISIPFTQYVLGVRELGRSAEAPFALQQGLLSAEPMRIIGTLDDGDVVWVRVIDVRKEGPATEWRTIEAQVREDLASIEGYNALVAQRDDLVSRVANVGVAALLDLNMPGATYNIDGKVSRQTVRLADGRTSFPEGNVQSFRDVVMDLIKPWDPSLDVATLPLESRTVSALDQATRRLIIGQVTGRTPMTIEQYSRNAGQITNRARVQSSQPGQRDPISFEAVAERLGYKPAEGPRKDEDEDQAASSEESAEQ